MCSPRWRLGCLMTRLRWPMKWLSGSAGSWATNLLREVVVRLPEIGVASRRNARLCERNHDNGCPSEHASRGGGVSNELVEVEQQDSHLCPRQCPTRVVAGGPRRR